MSRICIITPCYNAAHFIEATIQSVRSQTLTNWRHIIVDDGSTDESVKMVELIAEKEPHLRLLKKKNGGVASARNAGFHFGKSLGWEGDYLLFLDADDCLKPQMLELLTRYLDERPAVGMVYCAPLLIDAEGKQMSSELSRGWTDRYVPTRFGLRLLENKTANIPFISLFSCCWLIPSVSLIRRAAYEETPGFDEDFGHLFEDLDLFLQIALHSEVHYFSEPLLKYRQHSGQSTANADKMSKQSEKMYAKWREKIPTFTDEQRKRVISALRFRDSRVIPMIGLTAAREHAKQGDTKNALRFAGGAVKRYLSYLGGFYV